MDASSENKNFDDNFKSKTDGKNKSEREMMELSKVKELENVSMVEKDLVACLSTTDEVPSSPAISKKKVTTKNRKRKAETNEDVSTNKITKQILSSSMINKSKDESVAKKNLFACPTTEDEVTTKKIPNRSARRPVMHPPVSEMVLESLKTLKKRNGVTFQQISAQIAEKYQAKTKMLKSHINRFLRKAEDGGIIEKIIGAKSEEKFKLKKAVNTAKTKQVIDTNAEKKFKLQKMVNAPKAKHALILKKRKVELLKKTSVLEKQHKKYKK